MRTLADLDALVTDLRARLGAASAPEQIATLRHELRIAISARSRARHPDLARERYRRYRQRHYARQRTERPPETVYVTYTREPQPLSAQRVPEPNGRHCPKCSAALVGKDQDGPYCLYCGFHSWQAARPWLMEAE